MTRPNTYAKTRGVVSYISNYSWLDGLSHPVMRHRLATNFDAVWVDNCNGDKYRTGKRTPDGRPDESMFSTDDHRVGIQVGTAIATFLKTPRAKPQGDATKPGVTVHYREFWGTGNAKRSGLLESLNGDGLGVHAYQAFQPRAAMRWVFVPVGLGAASYETWCPIAELFPIHYSGLNENRQGVLFADQREFLEERMRRYFDPQVSNDAIKEAYPGLMTPAAGFEPTAVREALLAGPGFDRRNIVRVAFRPFDDVWVYWQRDGKLLNRCRPDFFEQVWEGNRFLSASQTGRKGGFNIPTIVDKFGDLHLQDPWSQFFPLWIRANDPLLGASCEPNVDRAVIERLCAAFEVEPFDPNGHATTGARAIAEDVFYHALAVLWSPQYRTENGDALKQDWPRIPLPADRAVLSASATLGRAVASLLLPDHAVRGVTAGRLRDELRNLAVPTKVGGGAIEPETDLKIEAGYGFRGRGSAVMCGSGRVVPTTEPAGAFDVYINDRVYWANVPADVWESTIGGYPVVKKWLSYREYRILGRPLRLDEVTYVTDVVRRLKALLLLGTELDASYAEVAADLIPVRE